MTISTRYAGASRKVNGVLEGHRSRAWLRCDAQRQGERHRTCGRQRTVAVAGRTGDRPARIVMALIAIPRRTNQCHAMRRARTVAPTTGQFRVKAVFELTSGVLLYRTSGRARIRLHALCRRR
jgi:hypothetical protein